jgi:general secretion pathway protein H
MIRNRRGGMTLVELILVMIVIFALATVVAPRFTNAFPALQVRSAADHLLAWARKARADAALTGARHRLVVDPAARKFWMEREPKPLKEPGKFVKIEGAWAEEALPGEVRFESTEGAEEDGPRRFLEFRADGTCTDATLVVANDQGDRREIEVTGATGRIVIRNPEAP